MVLGAFGPVNAAKIDIIHFAADIRGWAFWLSLLFSTSMLAYAFHVATDLRSRKASHMVGRGILKAFLASIAMAIIFVSLNLGYVSGGEPWALAILLLFPITYALSLAFFTYACTLVFATGSNLED